MSGVLIGLLAAQRPPLVVNTTSGSIVSETVGNGSQTYGSSTVSVSGGIPPYVYSWTQTGGDPEINPATPNAATTQWSSIGTDQTFSGNFICDVSDSDIPPNVGSSGALVNVTHGSPP